MPFTCKIHCHIQSLHQQTLTSWLYVARTSMIRTAATQSHSSDYIVRCHDRHQVWHGRDSDHTACCHVRHKVRPGRSSDLQQRSVMPAPSISFFTRSIFNQASPSVMGCSWISPTRSS